MPTLSLLAYVPSTGFLARFITPLKPLVLWWLGPEPPPDFYPARRHEKLNKRYRIQTKLGAGVWSSTWLVRDTSEVKRKKFYAVKILSLDATEEHHTGKMLELESMRKVRDGGPAEHLPALIDTFEIQCPKGKSHICLVMDVYGQDVATFRRTAPQKALPVWTVKIIIKQILQAAACLHERGIVHTDIKPDNMLFRTEMTLEAIEKWLENLPDSPDDNSACHPLPPDFQWNDPYERAKEMNVMLTDLGQSQRVGPIGQQTVDQFSAFSLRAPEVILRSDFGTAIDIWAVGCIVFEMLVGRWLFHPEDGGEDFSVEEDHLAKMLELTGERFSPAMLQRAELGAQYFDPNGDLIKVPDLYPVSLDDAMTNYKVLAAEEIGPAAAFIRECIHLEPAERPTAAELANHPWLQDL